MELFVVDVVMNCIMGVLTALEWGYGFDANCSEDIFAYPPPNWHCCMALPTMLIFGCNAPYELPDSVNGGLKPGLVSWLASS